METSLFLARIMGLYLVIAFVAVLINKKMISGLIKDTAKDTALIMFGGATALIIGLLVVLTHNVWTVGWVGLITLLGWICLVKGALMLLMPQKAPSLSVKMSDGLITFCSLIMLILGAFLAYIGFLGQ